MTWRKCKQTVLEEKNRASEFISALKQCQKTKDLEQGMKLHQQIVESRLDGNILIGNNLLNMYRRCENMGLARETFDHMRRKDVATWNSLMLGYVEQGEGFKALELLNTMDCKPSHVTYIAALKACTSLASKAMTASEKECMLERGRAIHEKVKEHGFDTDISVTSTLIDMYSKLGEMETAERIFRNINNKDVVLWNCLMLGYVENGQGTSALEYFKTMDCTPDRITYIAVLKACSTLAILEDVDRESILEKGISIHQELEKLGLSGDIVIASILIDMYSRCGSLHLARNVFEKVPRKDVVAWTCLILGYVENGESRLALDLFERMDCEPSHVTYLAALKASGSLAELQRGRVIHSRICRAGLEGDISISNTLVDFYGRCAAVGTAAQVFNCMNCPEKVSWNALVTGYSSLGDSRRVFSLVKQTEDAGMELDAVTFVNVLTACSRAGTVEEGRLCFQSMHKHKVRPSVEHYTCMVDMLGRANRLDEALSLINDMPFKADVVIWKSLLAACRRWKNVEVAKIAFQGILSGDQSQAGGAYVLMSEIYGSSNS